MGFNQTSPETGVPGPYQVFNLNNYRKIPQLQELSEDQLFDMKVVGSVLPFKSNNYVVDELINWDDPEDPIFHLTFPQRGMLRDRHYEEMADAIRSGNQDSIKEAARSIRLDLNPHPAGQKESNVPRLKDGTELEGVQHKYRETALFFPNQGQTCHAYCTFCFRWPQFVALDGYKFAMKEAESLVQYLREHPEITDLLFTGGDPMVMKTRIFKTYIDAVLEAKLPNLQTIRIGTKSLSYWPYRFLTDNDAQDMLDLLKSIRDRGMNLAIMAHFNHPNELQTEAVEQAIEKIRATGAVIRSQSPLLRNINDSADDWTRMWKRQVQLGIVPYYMFVTRDTGAQCYFSTPLVRAWEIYSKAIQRGSGLVRTARGPSMSCYPGKVEITGVAEVGSEKVIALRMLQGRNPEWTYKPFFAEYDEEAIWLDALRPAFGEERFFFDAEPKKSQAARILNQSQSKHAPQPRYRDLISAKPNN